MEDWVKINICEKCPDFVDKVGECQRCGVSIWDVEDCQRWRVEKARNKKSESSEEVMMRIEVRDKSCQDDIMQMRLMV